MLCKKAGCTGDMKYYNNYGSEGYKCPICGFKTVIMPHDISTEGLEGLEEFISYDANGNMCISDGIEEAYFKAHQS